MDKAGVRHVMKSLFAKVDILMDVAGFQNLDQIDRTALDWSPSFSITKSHS